MLIELHCLRDRTSVLYSTVVMLSKPFVLVMQCWEKIGRTPQNIIVLVKIVKPCSALLRPQRWGTASNYLDLIMTAINRPSERRITAWDKAYLQHWLSIPKSSDRLPPQNKSSFKVSYDRTSCSRFPSALAWRPTFLFGRLFQADFRFQCSRLAFPIRS